MVARIRTSCVTLSQRCMGQGGSCMIVSASEHFKLLVFILLNSILCSHNCAGNSNVRPIINPWGVMMGVFIKLSFKPDFDGLCIPISLEFGFRTQPLDHVPETLVLITEPSGTWDHHNHTHNPPRKTILAINNHRTDCP